MAPAAFLFDASESFSKRTAAGSGKGAGRTDESVRAMKPDLAAAVYTCIDAAGREWDVVWQRKLLNVRFNPITINFTLINPSGCKVWQSVPRSI